MRLHYDLLSTLRRWIPRYSDVTAQLDVRLIGGDPTLGGPELSDLISETFRVRRMKLKS